ncbi:peptidoglycan DD-metalloendopeptidase family protein [Aliidiomarina halalkaliphila]|uniref:Peptidoglycan DD-metalloendopeptidase family protein n=1 Tax=Aliidiomarina halalkaliphila TaxID=2593535 RepID=A0A552X3S7_9GAMM|nr:peptidoglycan DD-metalloendopeptidase family protein [Aliidiomarina halalkaliphila]TRW49616.1 peptidoglycan DD-metalloendopeptidase family protein [Aliidiomarina halalkaliphila]
MRITWVLGILGFIMVLQGCSAPHEPAPVERVYRGKTVHDYERATLTQATHQVQAGETLYSIAFRANMDMRDIARLNNIQPPYTIFVGQTLRLRAAESGSARSASSPPTGTTSGTSSGQSQPTTSSSEQRVASNETKEYGVTTSQQNSQSSTTSRETQQVIVNPTQRSVPSGDLRWQWPSQGRILRRFSTHEAGGRGMEFGGGRGDPVIAAAAGRVVYVGSALRGYGQLIILKHNDDYITAYGHNDQLMVSEQQWVEAGQQIATMGSSGREDVRLRFELRFRGNSVNPENYLPRTR